MNTANINWDRVMSVLGSLFLTIELYFIALPDLKKVYEESVAKYFLTLVILFPWLAFSSYFIFYYIVAQTHVPT